MKGSLFFVVDRIEGRVAVLSGDDRSSHDVPRRRLPRGAREGSVLQVALDDDGAPDFGRAVLDERETERRRAEARAVIQELRKRDPGGNMAL